MQNEAQRTDAAAIYEQELGEGQEVRCASAYDCD